MTYFKVIRGVGIVLLVMVSHTVAADTICSGISANLKCLKLNFDQLYAEDYVTFWEVLNKSAEEATQCRSINKAAEYLDLARITTRNAEFNEAFSKGAEEFCLRSPSCFKQAINLLDSETQGKLASMMDNPTFIDRGELRKADCLHNQRGQHRN